MAIGALGSFHGFGKTIVLLLYLQVNTVFLFNPCVHVSLQFVCYSVNEQSVFATPDAIS